MIDGGTIAALSTPQGRGGIAIIRISGVLTQNIVRRIIIGVSKNIPDRRSIHSFISNSEGEKVEECLYTFFKSPNSYTGEDLAEISIHSNPFLVEKVMALIKKNGARDALSGEFTLRAFKNKKIDLIQAESINELINANSRYFAEMKFGNLEGKLSDFLNGLKTKLVDIAVKVESIIEFQDDQLLEDIKFSPELESALEKINKIISGFRFNDMIDKGLKVVIVGKANVGKSSLFNSLLLKERSIISPVPGTTRDFISERINVEGYPIELTDVAGINSKSQDDIEKLGIIRSIDLLKNSDAVIFLLDGSSHIDENDRSIYDLVKKKRHSIFINKSDCLKNGILKSVSSEFNKKEISELSVLKNHGMKKVYQFLSSLVNEIDEDRTEISVNIRQKTILSEISDTLQKIKKKMISKNDDIEIIAEEFRMCISNIGKLVGEVTDEDILKRIFSKFCIGK